MSASAKQELPQKNPAAVVPDRLGGLKCGKVRAKALSKKDRPTIARQAGEVSPDGDGHP